MTSPVPAIGSRAANVIPAGGAVDESLVTEGFNAHQLHCPICNCKVLPAGRGQLHELPDGVFMHHDVQRKQVAEQQEAATGDPEEMGALEYWFWLVKDMWHFDNIGFSRDISGRYKYLICAECEAPIIGIQPDINRGDELLVSISRTQRTVEHDRA